MEKKWGETDETKQAHWNEEEAELAEYAPMVQATARKPRLAGLVLIVVGGLMAKFFCFDLLERLKTQQESSVTIHSTLIILIVILVELGLIYLIGGRKGVFLMASKTEDGRRMRPLQTAMALIMAATGLGFMFWFQAQLSTLGYQ